MCRRCPRQAHGELVLCPDCIDEILRPIDGRPTTTTGGYPPTGPGAARRPAFAVSDPGSDQPVALSH